MNTISNRVQPTASTKAVEYITFKVGKYLFALPSQAILKVVATPPPSQGGMVSMGLVQLEQYSIQIIDLSERLGFRKARVRSAEIDSNLNSVKTAGNSPKAKRKAKHKAEHRAKPPEQLTAEPNPNPPFLMVFQNSAGDLCGIAVETPPDLMNIPENTLKPVPTENRLTKALRWVSHIVVYEANGSRHTLLVLDLPLLLTPSQTKRPAAAPPMFTIEPPVDSVVS